MTFGAVASHAIGTDPGKVDADRDQAFACVQRAQCFADEQRIAAAEADLRQTRPSSAYHGPLYAEISPRTFPVLVREVI